MTDEAPTKKEILAEINNAVYSAWIAVLRGDDYPLTTEAIQKCIREGIIAATNKAMGNGCG